MFSAKNIVLLTEINGFFDASLLHNYMDVIIPSIISSLFLGNVLLKVIVDGFINSEDSMISGGSLINNSSFMSNITTLGQSYLILISIIVLSVVFASSLMLIKKPKEILSKIS
ncbi:hypothetical protein FXN81_14630 [Enterococcus faecium]|nr:hypothetical protein [Enterococcus faecium]